MVQAVKPNWHNRTLFQGDNLEFMQSMNSKTINLIATDPPFNKGKDFHATPESLAAGASFDDRWSWDEVRETWVDSIQDDHPAAWAVIDWTRMTYGDDMAAFLCFMAARLIEMRRILRDDGSIYLHCDPTASHYLKALMDSVFGRQQFRNELIWHYSGWNKKLRSHMERRHDVILFYAKTDDQIFHYPARPWAGKDEYLRIRRQKLRMDDSGREYVLSDAGGGTRVKRYLDEAMKYGVPLDDVWQIDKINNSDKIERTGYPTQKPLALYRRIIRASSNLGDIVFDPFAGCATTAIAAEAEGRQWVAADIWPGTFEVTQERLETLARPAGEGETSGLRLYEVTQRTDPLVRTDSGEVSAPPLKSVYRKQSAPTMRRAAMLAALIERDGLQCQGCGFEPPRPEYLELDHKLPRADGGSNELENRVLLCGPCNRAKGARLTLTGLREHNRKAGVLMAGLDKGPPKGAAKGPPIWSPPMHWPKRAPRADGAGDRAGQAGDRVKAKS